MPAIENPHLELDTVYYTRQGNKSHIYRDCINLSDNNTNEHGVIREACATETQFAFRDVCGTCARRHADDERPGSFEVAADGGTLLDDDTRIYWTTCGSSYHVFGTCSQVQAHLEALTTAPRESDRATRIEENRTLCKSCQNRLEAGGKPDTDVPQIIQKVIA